MKAMLAELLAELPDLSYSAAVPAIMANDTDIPKHEAMNIFLRPTTS
jgi:hypothetical protein